MQALRPGVLAGKRVEAGVGDAAVMGLPEGIEILRREDAKRVEYLVLGRKLRRPVRLWFDKGGGESWGSY